LTRNKQTDAGFEYYKEKEAKTYTCRSCLQKMENKPVGSPCVFAFDGAKKTFLFHR
jgi:5'-3' exonuclease